MAEQAAGFLLAETGGLAARESCKRFLRDGVEIVRGGRSVRVLLVQNGVTAAIEDEMSEVDELVGCSGELWVDEFSLAQRGIGADALHASARLVDMDVVAAAVLDPAVRVVWH